MQLSISIYIYVTIKVNTQQWNGLFRQKNLCKLIEIPMAAAKRRLTTFKLTDRPSGHYKCTIKCTIFWNLRSSDLLWIKAPNVLIYQRLFFSKFSAFPFAFIQNKAFLCDVKAYSHAFHVLYNAIHSKPNRRCVEVSVLSTAASSFIYT